MPAARFPAPNRIEPVEVEARKPAPGEATVRVESCGFCGSDFGVVSGKHPRAMAPLTIGHEVSGEVVEADVGAGLAAGTRVVLYSLVACGRCRLCQTGQRHVCRTSRVFDFDSDGGMADFLTAPVHNLLPLPADFPAPRGALLAPAAGTRRKQVLT
ncbi:MAG: alcohol dehydrogenase catalytic domain-containing protein [bacterium]|nr:alcohol dehydrogenase catalytic domain-containing protein [bacterium]